MRYTLFLISPMTFIGQAQCMRSIPVLRFVTRPSVTSIHHQMQRLQAERNAAELQAHQARQEAEFWKQQALRCRLHGCTQVCITHLQKNCHHAHQEQQQKALQAFYKQQALDQGVPVCPRHQK